ncbi:hypothetical protein F5Y05DRAFT_413206 [Hypoxylon sp. FL0543]|nr:hypothetical protein F5Y05DRAFT_413206 [Hypoxylon sp. FL0543]
MVFTTNSSCATGTYFNIDRLDQIPSNNAVGVATFRPADASQTLQNAPYLALMQKCCEDSPVAKLDDDCVLWCDLPPDLVDDHKAFRDCFVGNSAGIGIITTRDARNVTGTAGGSSEGGGNGGGDGHGDGGNGAAVMGGRPSVVGVGLLALVVGWFCLAV